MAFDEAMWGWGCSERSGIWARAGSEYLTMRSLRALSCRFWINLIADDLVALLSTFGEVLQQYIDSAILCLTVRDS
jgi:hypothetical protein